MIIDVHQHWIPREHMENIDRYLNPGQTVETRGGGFLIKEGIWEMFDLKSLTRPAEEHLRHLDEAGIDMAVLSMACYSDWVSAAVAPGVNNAMAELQAKYPDRFIGMAHVNALDEEAPAELERSVKELGLKGVSFNTNVRGLYPDGKEFGPLYRKVAELDVPIVIHGASWPYEERLRQITKLEIPGALLARDVDRTIVSARLITGSVIKEFPTIKFVLGQLGGSGFSTMMNRFGVRPGMPLWSVMKRQLFFDTAPTTWTRLALQTAIASFGADNVLMGSDYPAVPNDGPSLKRAVGAVQVLGLPPADEKKILGSTAAELFRVG